ncbi:MAG: MIP/aquaporin family protein [Candidatus Diapherotrites archaeon]|nr:MIP/aquaporin family protein [Candidatus Diapherotrites archaeon]
MNTYKEYIAEFIATFALIFFGAGSVVMAGLLNPSYGVLGVALAHGLILMAMIYATGHISGAHINPAVTVAMALVKKIQPLKAVKYIIAQLAGASTAGFILLIIFPVMPSNLGTTDLASNISFSTGILIEAILTFFLVFVIFNTAVEKHENNTMAGFAIGMTLAVSILFGGALTGASLNPARSFGPALASGHWANQIVYWIGPIVGACIAGLVYEFVLKKKQ